ncbi:MAG TPA: exosortase H-associated membrane protein [Usitatibacter sp.]|jgi:hypothetical protein|nr:exosortase H-associated membrane protein [Usitatibacter sp.]
MRFAAATLAWGVVFFALWFAASAPLSQAAGWVAAGAMRLAGPVDEAHAMLRGGSLAIEVQPDASIRYRDHVEPGTWFEITVNARKHTVGLAFFLALVAAARARRPARILAGCAVLILLAGLGIACEAALGFATVAAQGGRAIFRPGVAEGTALALGYQLATLIVPTLVPVALWLWAMARSDRAASADDPHQQHDDGHDEQDVDEAAHGVRSDHSEQPQHKQDDDKGIQHDRVPPYGSS